MRHVAALSIVLSLTLPRNGYEACVSDTCKVIDEVSVNQGGRLAALPDCDVFTLRLTAAISSLLAVVGIILLEDAASTSV